MNAAAVTARIRQLTAGGSPLRRQLAGAALGNLVLSLSARALALAMSILLARFLGAEGYGVYAAAMAVLAVLGVPTSLGLPTMLIRFLARYRVHGQWGLMRGLLLRANQVVLALSVLLAGGGAVVVWALSERLAPAQVHTLWWTMALLPLTALGALRMAALSGLHHVVLGQLPEDLLAPGLFVALLAAWSTAASGLLPALTPDIAVALRLAAFSVAFLAGAWLLLRRLPSAVRHAPPRYDMAGWARAAGPLLLLGGMSILNTQTDILMLSAIRGAESAGVYHAAARGADLVAFSLMVVDKVIQPTIARLYAGGERQLLQRVVTVAARGMLTVAVPSALVLTLFAEPILGTVFGPEFVVGALCLAILCAAQVVNAGTGSVGQILNMTGHEKDTAALTAISTVLNIALNALLIPFWGMEGAAAATAVTLVVWNVSLAVAVRRRTGLYGTALGGSG